MTFCAFLSFQLVKSSQIMEELSCSVHKIKRVAAKANDIILQTTDNIITKFQIEKL